MDTIITVLDATTETSMPFNEFVIWRAVHYRDQKQVLIVCDKNGNLPQIVIPSNVEIIRCEKKLASIRGALNKVIRNCKEHNNRYAIHLHHVDSGLWAQLAMIGTGYRKKTLFTTHSTFSGYPFHNKVRSFINGCCAHYVSIVSNSAFAGYPKIIKAIKRGRVLAIQNGVDIERIDRMMDSDVIKRTDRIVFVYIARMVPVKNHEFLLDVIKNVDDRVCFVFIGAKNHTIEKRIESEGLGDKVFMTGLIPRNEVFKKLQEAHFYVSSSVLEGLPVSLLEGMYVGLPAIVSDIPQHAEVSTNSEFFSLLPLEKDKWVEKINQMVSMPHKYFYEVGLKSKRYIRDNFSLEKMHQQYDTIYEKLMLI